MISKAILLLTLAASAASVAAIGHDNTHEVRSLTKNEASVVDFAVRSHLVDGANAVLTMGDFITKSYDAYCGLVKPSQLDYEMPFFMLLVSYGQGDTFDSAVNVRIPGNQSEIEIVKKMCNQVGYTIR
ncbi:TPA: hypothetical protein MM005_005044 [Klebsiella pneumoniae]|uniref:hypothetical protein n=1 Tax=Klebsiella pneumoniae complex TaxID=3390273 RepID=UPI0026E5645E|nr:MULTISPECIES: hypothetical protein [Klebsiella]MDO6861453.1 hypothetical protein [Klebsiella pneumoniae]MDT9982526.1 hypothetical protein [Klebsiella pneumoniae]MDZ0789410.1 hypothetical protein [Klebsiella quasipneumoniae]HBQ6735851.1 hypothetical protein [Klebsiella pneumoniae]HBZ7245618.1 hypothetical protein [Klebsiella pneumoniae]